MLTIALAKGRTAEGSIAVWRDAGIPAPADLDEGRALMFELKSTAWGDLRYLLVKPVDVPTYVQFGVADIGVVGKDVLMEQEREVYELLDLGTAKCKLCVAGHPSEQNSPARKVATKYPRLTDAYFRSQGRAVEIVPLSGSIELAPVIGLTDRIFDLVQTGSTLKAHGLVVFDEVADVSARLIANKSSYRTKRALVDRLTMVLGERLARSEGESE